MAADNVFHPLCYEGAVDFAAIQDPRERLAKEAQVPVCAAELRSRAHLQMLIAHTEST